MISFVTALLFFLAGAICQIVEDDGDTDTDFIDLHSLFKHRYQRDTGTEDYSTGIGGPIAAADLPPSVSPIMKKVLPVKPLRNECKLSGSGDCVFDMRPLQGITVDNKTLLSLIQCRRTEDCISACEKQSCNYLMRTESPSGGYMAFLYRMDERNLKTAKYSSSAFHAMTKICPETQRSKVIRTKRQGGCCECCTSIYGPPFDPPGCCDPSDPALACQNSCPLIGPPAPPHSPPPPLSPPPGVSVPGIPNMPGGAPNYAGPNNLGPALGLGLGAGLGIGLGVGLGAGLGVGLGPKLFGEASSAKLIGPDQTLRAQIKPPPPPAKEKCGHFFNTKYVKHYDRRYEDQDDRNLHLKQFCENVQTMHQINVGEKKDDDAKCGITRYSDLSQKEFHTLHTGAIVDRGNRVPRAIFPPIITYNQTNQTTDSIISNFQYFQKQSNSKSNNVDWRTTNVIPPVRDQGICGSCYAFTIADLISSQNAILEHLSTKLTNDRSENNNHNSEGLFKLLSPQYIVDCASKKNSTTAFGCKGGKPIEVLNNFINDPDYHGVPLEACYGYRMRMSSCPVQMKCCEKRLITQATMLDARGRNEKSIMANFLNYGPVIAIIHASEVWQFYNGTGIIKSYQCNNNADKKHPQNHAVLLTGYDYSGPTPYYLVKSSWNTDWGDFGYAKLEAGTDACNVAKTIIRICARHCDTFVDD